jgi:hypothetical protein
VHDEVSTVDSRHDPVDAQRVDALVLHVHVGDHEVENDLGAMPGVAWSHPLILPIPGEPALGEADRHRAGRLVDVVLVQRDPRPPARVERGQAGDVVGHDAALDEFHVRLR